MTSIPRNRPPTHPGEVLLHEFLDPLNLTQKVLAEGIRVPFQRFNEIVNGKRSVSASTALRLSRFFGNSAGFWLNLQQRCDLYAAQQAEAKALENIERFQQAETLASLCAVEPL